MTNVIFTLPRKLLRIYIFAFKFNITTLHIILRRGESSEKNAQIFTPFAPSSCNLCGLILDSERGAGIGFTMMSDVSVRYYIVSDVALGAVKNLKSLTLRVF